MALQACRRPAGVACAAMQWGLNVKQHVFSILRQGALGTVHMKNGRGTGDHST